MSIRVKSWGKKKNKGQRKKKKRRRRMQFVLLFPSRSPPCPARQREKTNKQERTCACSRAAKGETAEPGRLCPGEAKRRGRGWASEGFGVGGEEEDDDVTGDERVDDATDEQHLLPAATGRASVPAAAGFIDVAMPGAP